MVQPLIQRAFVKIEAAGGLIATVNRSTIRTRKPTLNLWTDAWLAALALSLNYEVATFDRGFRSFRGLRVRLLTPPNQ